MLLDIPLVSLCRSILSLDRDQKMNGHAHRRKLGFMLGYIVRLKAGRMQIVRLIADFEATFRKILHRVPEKRLIVRLEPDFSLLGEKGTILLQLPGMGQTALEMLFAL